MNNYKGYYIKINGCEFNNPLPKSYRISPKIIQDMDSERTADGSLHRNILPHTTPKIELTFPIMKLSQAGAYMRALDGDYLSVEYYDVLADTYKTFTMYHNDITVELINTGMKDEKYIGEWSFNLIGY